MQKIDKNAEIAKQIKKNERAAAARIRQAEKKAEKQARKAAGGAVAGESGFQSDNAQTSVAAVKNYAMSGATTSEETDTQVKRASLSLLMHADSHYVFDSIGRRNIKRIRDALLGKNDRTKNIMFYGAKREELMFTDEQRVRFSWMSFLVVSYSIKFATEENSITYGAAVFRTAGKHSKKYRFVTRLDFDANESEAHGAYVAMGEELRKVSNSYLLAPILG